MTHLNMKMVGVGVTHLACLRVGQENTHLPLDDSEMKDSQLPLAADYGVTQVEQGKCIEKTADTLTPTRRGSPQILTSRQTDVCVCECVHVCVYTSPKKTWKQEKGKNMQQKYLRLEACSLKIHRVFL